MNRNAEHSWMPTDEEEAQIIAAVESDPDDWFPTDEELAQARPIAEVHPEIVAAYLNGGIQVTTETLANMTAPKQPVTLNLDKGLLTYFRQTGDGWEQRINDALRSVAFAGCDPRAGTYESDNGVAVSDSVAD